MTFEHTHTHTHTHTQARMAKYHNFWKFLAKKHCFGNKWQGTTFSKTQVSETRVPHQFCQIKVGSSWMDLIVLFLKEGVLPLESEEAKKIRRKTPHFQLSEEQKLYKCSFLGPYLLCVYPEVVKPLLEEFVRFQTP